jgi:hypothetical protein
VLQNNFDSFVLREAEREAIDEIAEPDLRELIRDYFLQTRFDSQISGSAQEDFASITPPSATVRSAATPRTVWPSAAKRSSIKRLVMPDKPLTTSAEFRKGSRFPNCSY